MLKTLLFTTSYCTDNDTWQTRNKKWLDFVSKSPLQYTKLLMLDDCSPVLPQWDNISILRTPFEGEIDDKNVLLTFNKNLGRHSLLDYPGWYRSYSFAAKYAYKFGYQKVIHIESDAYVLTQSMYDYINNLNTGWVTFWCKQHNFPENAIQVICEDEIYNFYKISSQPYSVFKGKDIERMLPYTKVERNFIGDRYSEYTDTIPDNADYACQVRRDVFVSARIA